MKRLTVLVVLSSGCAWEEGQSAEGALAQLVEDRNEVHASFEESRDERKEQLLFGGHQRAGNCKQLQTLLTDIDPDRSLFVHDKATLDGADFSLRRTLSQLAAQAINSGADPATTPESLFIAMFGDQEADAPDTTCPDATGLVNGFPYGCRAEGVIPDAAIEIDSYFPIALVNRMDNASDDWTDCGEHRIVYARTPVGNKRNFIIFESVLPNPSEGCKEGCRTVARWWADLSNQDDPLVRAGLLEDLYYRPLNRGPKKYKPVVHFDHYSIAGVDTPRLTSKGGQIRTNQRLQSPWMLKEYKTVLDCAIQPCVAEVVPVAVGRNPFEALFDSNEEFTAQVWSSLVPTFQADFLLQRDLITTGTSAIDYTYEVDPLFNAAESPVDNPVSDYLLNTDATFLTNIETGGPVGFTGAQIVNRATALNCAGCHEPSRFGLTTADSLATGLSFPDSLRFVHTNDLVEVVLPIDTVFGIGEGFALSPALINNFIPARALNLLDQLNQEICICQPAMVAMAARGAQQQCDALSRVAETELEQAIANYDGLVFENDALEAAGIPVDRSSERAALDAIDDVVWRSNDAMVELMASVGVDVSAYQDEDVMWAATPFRTSPGEDLAVEVQQAIDSVPPRRTITGSFTTH